MDYFTADEANNTPYEEEQPEEEQDCFEAVLTLFEPIIFEGEF